MMPTAWEFYTSASSAWEAMLNDCKNAKRSIDLEQYIFADDEIGGRFLDVMEEKAKQGIRVRLLCDGVGSFGFMNSAVPARLSAGGIQLQFYNPISPWRIDNYSSWFLRDHRKILVVDQEIGHVGTLGINFRMRNWRDTHVKFTGEFVKTIYKAFEVMWIANLKHRRSLASVNSSAPGFTLLTNSLRRRDIYSSLLDAVRGSTDHIYLTSPYFVPDFRLFRSLRLAAKRGVDVRILVPAQSDVRIMDIAGRSYYGLLMKSGAKIYLYKKDRKLHTKSVVIDRFWSSVGSCNLDNLSLKYNYEANVVSTDAAFSEELKKQFLHDLVFADMLDSVKWGSRGLVSKIMEAVTWPIHNFL